MTTWISSKSLRDFAEIKKLFQANSGDRSYGENLSVRDHMLQTASILRQAAAPDAWVIAGLLHDIGWQLGGESHEEAGARFSYTYFGAKVAEPIRLHVNAKRWLVANEAGYEASLSTTSRATLALQGGAFNQVESQSFAAHPYFDAAICLRRADDQAKVIGLQSPGFDTYRETLLKAMVT